MEQAQTQSVKLRNVEQNCFPAVESACLCFSCYSCCLYAYVLLVSQAGNEPLLSGASAGK